MFVVVQEGTWVVLLIPNVDTIFIIWIDGKPCCHVGGRESRIGIVRPLHGGAVFVSGHRSSALHGFLWMHTHVGDNGVVIPGTHGVFHLRDVSEHVIRHANLLPVIQEGCSFE